MKETTDPRREALDEAIAALENRYYPNRFEENAIVSGCIAALEVLRDRTPPDGYERGRAEVLREVAKLPNPVDMEVVFKVSLGYGVKVWRCCWCQAEWPCVDLSERIHPDNGCLWQ